MIYREFFTSIPKEKLAMHIYGLHKDGLIPDLFQEDSQNETLFQLSKEYDNKFMINFLEVQAKKANITLPKKEVKEPVKKFIKVKKEKPIKVEHKNLEILNEDEEIQNNYPEDKEDNPEPIIKEISINDWCKNRGLKTELQPKKRKSSLLDELKEENVKGKHYDKTKEKTELVDSMKNGVDKIKEKHKRFKEINQRILNYPSKRKGFKK